MDIQPPPPLFRNHHHHHHHHIRYGNVLRPPDFLPAPYPHHLPPPLPPPPPTSRPSNNLLPPPPPPPPPMRHMSPPSLPRFAFSPPRYPIIERSNPYEFDSPPKSYIHPTFLPPPPPPPPRENIPLRFVHDHPKRYRVIENEIPRGRIDNIRELPETWDRNLRWGAMDAHIRVPDIDVGGRNRYRNVNSERFELYGKGDDGRRWDGRISDWGRDFENRRDYDERRRISGTNNLSRDLYRERDYDERRWDNGMNYRSRDLYKERDCDERRWDSGMNDRSRELYREHNFDERRWDIGGNNQGCDLFCQVDDDERRWDSSRTAGVLSRLGNRKLEFAEDDLSLGGVLSRLGNRQPEFAKDDPCLGGALSRLGNRQPEFADGNMSFGGVLSRLGNRQPEPAEDDLSLGRFSGRLGTMPGKREFSSPDKKKRFQKKNTFHRIQLGKVCSRHSGGFKPHHFAEDRSRGSFKVREKETGMVQTRVEKGKREREQSPMELAISFKSNALVAKAIQVPYNPAVEPCANSKSAKERLGCNVSALPAAKNDVVSDLQSDSQGTSKDHQDEAAVSGSGRVTASFARDLSENILNNAHSKVMSLERPTIVRSGETHSNWLRKKKRATEQLLLDPNLWMIKDSHDISVGTCKPCVPKLKRKRSSLNTPSLSYVADSGTTKCSGRAEGLVTTTEDANHARQLRNDEVACHAHANLSPNENTSSGDSLSFNQHVNIVNKCLHDRASALTAENGAQYIKWDSDRVEAVSEHTVPGEEVLEGSITEEPFEELILDKDYAAGLSRSQVTRISDVHEDNYISDIHELVSPLKSGCEVMQTSEDAFVSDLGSQYANSVDSFRNQASVPHVMLDAKDFRSVEGAAVVDCSNVAFDISVSSHFLSANDRGTLPEFDVSFPNMGTDFSRNIESIEGSPEVKSDRETCLPVKTSYPMVLSDRESFLTTAKKRNYRGAQMGLSGTKTSADFATVRSIGSEVTRCLTKDIVHPMDGDIVGRKDGCNDITSFRKSPSRLEDSLLEFHFNAEASFPGHQKKLKLSSPRSSLTSLSEDDTIADGHSDQPILVQPSAWPSECGAELMEDTSSASTTIKQCGSTDVEGEVDNNDFYVVNLVYGDRSDGNDDLDLIASAISCTDRNGLSASNSGDDEPLASGFDMRSCMTSSEELHVYSDLSFSRDKASACLSDSEMICRSDNIFNKKPVIADPNKSSLGKCLGALKKSQSNADIPQSLQKGTNQGVKKLYPVPGKLTWSKNQVTSAVTKVFPAQHPSSFSNTRKLYSSHATKSRMWCRNDDSAVAVAEPKLQPSPVPQSNGTTAASKSVQSSYIRKGNSLVRKPSPSGDSSPGFHGSSCPVYQLSHCTNNMKSSLATDNKTGGTDLPIVKQIGRVITSELTKAPTLSHSGSSLSCSPGNLEEPLPVRNLHRNGGASKTLDVMKQRVKPSLVPERQTDLVINSDSRSTLGEGDSEKKITYVKRRSYQLVATSNSDDISTLRVDNNQSQLSDGYYKSRENQLVRASPENHDKGGNANVNASRLVPQSSIPKTSTRRPSGFTKTSKYSKLSFVWKLHDTQSSEKHKTSLGPLKVWPHLFSLKRAAYWRSLILGIKPSLSTISQKLLLSRKRGAVYTRSSHGYSLRMSKVLSVGGSSLKWSKSIEKDSKKANEDATRAVAAAEKRKKEEKGAVPLALKRRNHVSRKLVLSVKLRPGERIFRIGSERYKMDATRRTLHRITEAESSSSVAHQSGKTVKRSYIPRRFLIGNEEYIRIGNGNQLIRDPKKRTRVLASEKVRWSLRTARLRLARKRKYCQFFTRYGKCNKDDGKCPYIHDPSKIVVCTKFLAGSCTNINCKLTHKVIPERMQDCAYFLKGSCSKDNCPYRHVHVNPDSTVCESFLRGYCADGNECQKKHTYVCPGFEANGVCPQVSTCKLHHPKKKTEKPTSEQKAVRGRYFDGGLIGVADCSEAPTEKLSTKGKDDIVVDQGKFPDYISLDVSDDEADQTLVSEKVSDEVLPDAQIEDLGELS